MILLREGRDSWGAHGLFLILIAMYIAQSLLVGLRWGYGLTQVLAEFRAATATDGLSQSATLSQTAYRNIVIACNYRNCDWFLLGVIDCVGK